MIPLKSISFLIVVFFITYSRIFAQGKDVQLDSLFNFYSDNGSFSGVVLAVEKGIVIYKKAFGFSDFEKKECIDTCGVFNIASITKPFTALAVMMLMEEGKLSLDDKLSKYFSDFPPYTDSITITHLLTHTSGIKDYENELHLNQYNSIVKAKLVYDSLISQPKLNMRPGEKYSYSNSGYFLLALIIEKVSGKSYKDFIETRIFQPLGMRHSYILTESDTIIPRRVNGYFGNWNKIDDDLNLRVPGDGNIFTTASDLLLFVKALDDSILVSKQTIEFAYNTPAAKSIAPGYKYGFGWIIQQDSIGTYISHNGGEGGFRCQLWRNRNKNNVLIVLSNTTFLAECRGILSGSQNILNDQSYTLGKIPITELFYEKYNMRGFDAAMRLIRKEKENSKSIYDFQEEQINNLGLDFAFFKSKPLNALEIFKFNTELFPESWNAWDSLGETYYNLGNYKLAKEAFEKSYIINPGNKNAKSRIDEIGSK